MIIPSADCFYNYHMRLLYKETPSSVSHLFVKAKAHKSRKARKVIPKKVLYRLFSKPLVSKSFHDIRRNVLTNLYYAKMPLKDIQRFAGHSSIQQTMDYIKIKEDDLSSLSFIETLMPMDEGISTEIISFEKKKATVNATGNPCFSR